MKKHKEPRLNPNEVVEQVSDQMDQHFLQTGWFYIIVGVGVLFISLYVFSTWTDIPRKESTPFDLEEVRWEALEDLEETLEVRTQDLEDQIADLEDQVQDLEELIQDLEDRRP